jgi:hypothetical protein
VRAIVAGHELDNILVLEIDLEGRKRAKGNLGDSYRPFGNGSTSKSHNTSPSGVLRFTVTICVADIVQDSRMPQRGDGFTPRFASASANPGRCRMREALELIWTPAPTSLSVLARS